MSIEIFLEGYLSGSLEARERLRLSLEIGEWARRGLGAAGVQLSGILPDVALASARLPEGVHADPTDHMLIATARQTGATLVTRDPKIVDYGRQGLLAVMDAGE